MKKLYSLFLFLFILSGCTPLEPADKCKDVTCQNGGSCSEGVCTCPTGYTGELCQTVLPGTVVAKIEPFGRVDSVTLTGTTPGTYDHSYQAVPYVNGSFIFTNIKPGGYILHVILKKDSLYFWPVTPSGKSVVVEPADTTEVETITIQPNPYPQTGTVTYSLNGGPTHTLYYNDFSASYGMSPNYGLQISISGREAGSNFNSFFFVVYGFNGPGDYLISYLSHMEVRCTAPSGYWGSGHSYGDVATLHISSLDPVTRRFSGSVSGKLAPIYPSYDTVQISASFTNVSYPPQ